MMIGWDRTKKVRLILNGLITKWTFCMQYFFWTKSRNKNGIFSNYCNNENDYRKKPMRKKEEKHKN